MFLVCFHLLLGLILPKSNICLGSGQKMLLAEPGLVKSLVNTLSTASPDGQKSAGCLKNLACSG